MILIFFKIGLATAQSHQNEISGFSYRAAYTHPDGGMVRVKPNGDATSRYRPQPHASKSVRYPADASFENFEYEAFKVDDLGMALPKWSKDIRNPYGNNTPKGAPFLDNWADDTHINLQLAN